MNVIYKLFQLALTSIRLVYLLASRVCNNLVRTLLAFDGEESSRARVTTNGGGGTFLSLGSVDGFNGKYALAGDDDASNICLKLCQRHDYLPFR